MELQRWGLRRPFLPDPEWLVKSNAMGHGGVSKIFEIAVYHCLTQECSTQPSLVGFWNSSKHNFRKNDLIIITIYPSRLNLHSYCCTIAAIGIIEIKAILMQFYRILYNKLSAIKQKEFAETSNRFKYIWKNLSYHNHFWRLQYDTFASSFSSRLFAKTRVGWKKSKWKRMRWTAYFTFSIIKIIGNGVCYNILKNKRGRRKIDENYCVKILTR